MPEALEDDDGFADFFRRTRPLLTRTLTALTDDTRIVEDVVQESLLIAGHRWAEVGGYDKPEAWVIKVALRRMRRWQAGHRETTLKAVHDVPHDPIAQRDDLDELLAAIRGLSPRRAEVIVLHHLLGYSIAEVAEVLCVTENTVRTHLSLGRADLKARLR
ncbi:hypothetical protein Lesp02_32110 [Lentzea sp. NBRC 105346]|uniref:RNA polymerase sigma factor n=1 Tax=Lentzea sp. NBRC 105346 TaxID=3032205 RepID=UPI0024A5DF80|nr:sigma-70 family RNA polymerase sigma factor [Lentzea sp. NBRC 105346]GLZ31022.1 hypothetical protein Lesp02_32110 [Lentzea sp. NBRC 105346]